MYSGPTGSLPEPLPPAHGIDSSRKLFLMALITQHLETHIVSAIPPRQPSGLRPSMNLSSLHDRPMYFSMQPFVFAPDP